MSNQDIDIIDKYLLEQMSAEEKTAFVLKMETNESLAQEVASHNETMDYIRAIAKEKMKEEAAAIAVNVDEVWEEPNEQLISKRKFKPAYTYLAIAASIALLVGLSVLFNQSNGNKFSGLVDKYYKVHPVVARGGDDTDKAYELYSYKKYREAIPLLKDCKSVEPECNLLLGNAYYEQQAYKQALQAFETLIQDTDNNRPYINDSRWYASLSYLQLNEPQKAIETLSLIVDNKDAGKKLRDKAKNLLSELNKQLEK